MRLGVDCWRAHGVTGVARYVRNVLDAWGADFGSEVFEEVTLFTPRHIDSATLARADRMGERVLASGLPQLVWQNARLGPACDTDVLWCPAYVAPIRTRARVVVTTHDATNAIHPELYPARGRLFYRRFYAWCARRATLVVTNNEQTRLDIQRYYGVPSEKIRVVPLAPAHMFRRLTDPVLRAETVRRVVGDDIRFFLSVGKISARRNVPTLVAGFAEFRRRTSFPHRLVIVGRGTAADEVDAMIAELGIEKHVTRLEYVSDDDLVALYNGADALITAATYEANSFTTLEAQRCGTAVIIPDVPGMREMVKDVAVVMPAIDRHHVAEALERVAGDDGLRSRLGEEGHEHASGLSWANTATRMLEVMEEASRNGT